LIEEDKKNILDRIQLSTDLESAAKDADFIVEAIPDFQYIEL
jgi:3-hydroxyacyl-CoA dehydrogenase